MSIRLYDAEYLQLLRGVLSGLKKRSYSLLGARRGERIGDIGCGTGEDAWKIAQTGADVIGFDIDEEFINAAQRYIQPNLRLSFELNNACAIPHESGSFDKLRYERVFQHLDDPQAVLYEARRLLKTGGHIQIVDADYLSLTTLYPDVAVERIMVDHLVYDRLPNAHKVRCIPQYLVEEGFHVTGIEIYPLVITDPDVALRVIRLPDVVRRLTHDGTLDSKRSESLIDSLEGRGAPFNLSINELIFSARAGNFSNRSER